MWRSTPTHGNNLKLARILPDIATPFIPDFVSNQTNLSDDVLNFKSQIDSAYNEVIKWRKNIFTVPKGKVGRQFVEELTLWLEHFNESSVFQCIALKVFMLLPSLLLQKPSATSKKQEHAAKLEARLKCWKDRVISNLLKEGRLIQKILSASKKRPSTDHTRKLEHSLI